MNLFKVIASGKKNINEEQLSTILAWLLHPHMEHGLGYEFLSQFIGALAKENPALNKVQETLRQKLRGENNNTPITLLEDNASGQAFVDVTILLEDWCIGIENKIYAGSASDKTQLNREYNGLCEKYEEGKKQVFLVFLVPALETGVLDNRIKEEFDAFEAKESGALMTWGDNKEGYPCVVSIIRQLLEKEQQCQIEPIHEYTRHTLIALCAFIKSGFAGYDYEKDASTGNLYPKCNTANLMQKTKGFVGVKGGVSGLLNMKRNEIQVKWFQYNEDDMSNVRMWLALDVFKQIAQWKLDGTPPVIKWDHTLSARNIYQIAKACPQQEIYVGISGGENSLINMDLEKILNSRWQVKSDERPSSQWFSLQRFKEIVDNKGFVQGDE